MHKRLEIEPTEAETVRRMFDLFVHHSMGAGEVAKLLSKEGRLDRSGRSWSKQTILKMMRKTLYIGQCAYNRYDSKERQSRPKHEWIHIDVPAIVPVDTFNKAQERLGTYPWKAALGTTPTSSLLLSGMVYCGKCGEKMISGRACNSQYGYYVCRVYKNRTKAACPGVGHIPLEKLHAAVLDTVVNKILSGSRIAEIAGRVRRAQEVESADVERHRRAVIKAKSSIAKYLSAFESGAMDAVMVDGRLRELKEEIARHEAEVERLHALGGVGEEQITATVNDIRETVSSYENPRLVRRYLSKVIDRVTVEGKTMKVKAKSVTEFLPSVLKWQPVGESNPCDGTENPASSTTR